MFSARLRLSSGIPLDKVRGAVHGCTQCLLFRQCGCSTQGLGMRVIGLVGFRSPIACLSSVSGAASAPRFIHQYSQTFFVQVVRLVDETLEMTELAPLQHSIVGEGQGGQVGACGGGWYVASATAGTPLLWRAS